MFCMRSLSCRLSIFLLILESAGGIMCFLISCVVIHLRYFLVCFVDDFYDLFNKGWWILKKYKIKTYDLFGKKGVKSVKDW